MHQIGAEGIRTPDLFLAKEAFSQLNYGPGVRCHLSGHRTSDDRCPSKSEAIATAHRNLTNL